MSSPCVGALFAFLNVRVHTVCRLKNNNLTARAALTLGALYKHAPVLVKLEYAVGHPTRTQGPHSPCPHRLHVCVRPSISGNQLGDTGVGDLLKGLCRCRDLRDLKYGTALDRHWPRDARALVSTSCLAAAIPRSSSPRVWPVYCTP